MRFQHRAAALVVLGCVSLGHQACAQQVLYTPVPPKGSAYVRFVNALEGAAKISPNFLPAQTLGSGTTDRVTSYAVVEHATGRAMILDVTDGALHGHATITAPADHSTTVILRPDGTAGVAAVSVLDDTDFNQTRAHLAFYNATADCAAGGLKLEANGKSVFANVAPGAVLSRTVAPVTANVVPTCAAGDAPVVALKGLEAGAMYSVWLMQPSPATKVTFVSRDANIPWKP